MKMGSNASPCSHLPKMHEDMYNYNNYTVLNLIECMNFDFEKRMISGKDYQSFDPYMYIII